MEHPSCHSFKANAVRLQLHALAYNLANFLRSLALPVEVEQWSMTTLRDRLVKIGAKIVRHGRSIIFQMAGGHGAPRSVRENPVHHCGAPSVAVGTMLSINTIGAPSGCRRTGAPEGGCSGPKLARAGGHRTAATLPAVLRSSRTLPGGQNDAYRSQKVVETQDHPGNVGYLEFEPGENNALNSHSGGGYLCARDVIKCGLGTE
jgi:Transposase DDE domain group 1